MAVTLQGKTAVVTGGSRGIGRGIALELAARGANVVIDYHANRQAAEEVSLRIAELGQRCVVVQADVGDPAQADALVDAGVRGLVVAGTGNGTVHRAWVDALARAQTRGVAVRRASRCALGGVVGAGDAASGQAVGPLSVPQARVELILDLLPREG